MIVETAANLTALVVNQLNVFLDDKSFWFLKIACCDWCNDHNSDLNIVHKIWSRTRSRRFLDDFLWNPFASGSQSSQGNWIGRCFNKLIIKILSISLSLTNSASLSLEVRRVALVIALYLPHFRLITLAIIPSSPVHQQGENGPVFYMRAEEMYQP